jgi:deazaflavin-dependent oxidoreductase (nitroreductase family)
MSDPLDWNAKTIAEFRANQGRVGGPFEGAPLVLVHHRGRNSGQEHLTPMMYLPHDTDPDIIYVFATKAGAPTNPDWYRNLTAAGEASVERGTQTYKATVRELAGAERDRVYAEQAQALPRLRRIRPPNRWNPHHPRARTQPGLAHTNRKELPCLTRL